MASDLRGAVSPASGGTATTVWGGLVAVAVGTGVVATLLSFRVPFPSVDAAVHANAVRMLAAGAVGAMLALAATLRSGSAVSALREPMGFALSAGGAIGLTLGAKLVGGGAATLGLGLAGAAMSVGLVRAMGAERRVANLGLGLVLITLFVGTIPATLMASSERDGLAGAAIWLLGDVGNARGPGAIALATAAVAGCIWAAFGLRHVPGPITRDDIARRRGLAVLSPLLVGLAVGAAGPVAFVGGASGGLVAALAPTAGASRRIVASAAVGAALVMLADGVPRFLIGGYAPPLNVTIAFIAIPGFLAWNRRRLRAIGMRPSGRVFEVVEGALIVGIALGLMGFARALTGFVRAIT